MSSGVLAGERATCTILQQGHGCTARAPARLDPSCTRACECAVKCRRGILGNESFKDRYVGGGLAGLATAAALSHFGVEADVFESAPSLGEIGAGINVRL